MLNSRQSWSSSGRTANSYSVARQADQQVLPGGHNKNDANFNQSLLNQQQQQSASNQPQQKLAGGSRASFPATSSTSTTDEDYETSRELHRRPRRRAGAGALWRMQSMLQAVSGRPRAGTKGIRALADRLRPLANPFTFTMGFLLLLNLLIYFFPLGERFQVEPRVAAHKPRPKFEGPLGTNSLLDSFGERLYENQFHGPECMAWTSSKRAFFTGVEGGFILLVEPYAERWTVAARLNARNATQDKSPMAKFELPDGRLAKLSSGTAAQDSQQFVPYCTHDVELYGPRAEFEPSLVKLSRCSRPLGLRLAPDDSRLYVMDPLSGLYRIDLAPNWERALANQLRPLHRLNQVSKLIDFARQVPEDERPLLAEQVYFADDIAVDFQPAASALSDVVYMTDCSSRWSLRYLIWLMLENDESGRVLEFDVQSAKLKPMQIGRLTSWRAQPDGPEIADERGLSFPNGIELTANKSALLISDLNNRRILKHNLAGPKAGQTELLMWVPGYSDNIRRGLDLADGTPTYWYACGCAVADDKIEVAEFFNELPWMKRLFLRWLHLAGSSFQLLGDWLHSTPLKDAGLVIDAGWLKVDPYCTHGLVAQFSEQGQVLRSLHGPSFGSHFKLLSEAHQVPLLDIGPDSSQTQTQTQAQQGSNSSMARSEPKSVLYLGSVYYSYLGRVALDKAELEQPLVVPAGEQYNVMTFARPVPAT